MIKNNVYYEFFASYMVPNSNEVGYWIDLGANSKGKVIKVYNPDIKSWVKLTDATSEDAVAPFIGSNGNWWIDNRDTGIPASGKSPIIGENGNWWIFDPALNEYADTGATAYGKTAYEYAVDQWKNANKPDNLGIAIIYGDKKLLLDYKNMDQYNLRLYDFGTDMPIASSDTDALKDLNGFQNCTYAFANSPSFQEIAINLKLTTPNNEDLFPHVLSFGEAAILQRFGDDLNTAIVEVGRKGYSPFWTSTRVNNEEFWWIESIDFVNANTSEGILQAMVHYTTSQEDTLYFLPIFDLSNQ